MKYLKFRGLLQEGGWITPAYICIDSQGIIQGLSEQAPSNLQWPVEDVPYLAIPGIANAHSHAFQFAMAGRAEGTVKGHENDDFWAWRHLMYKLALKISPEAVESIATYLYSQMLCYGYTSVAEFHYIHHDPNGRPYSDPGELSKRLLAAAARAGIDICLVPIYYRTSDFAKPALAEQRRFISKGTGDFYRLMDSVKQEIVKYPNARLGIGVHSLRAAPIDEIREICSTGFLDLPVHLHISEQTAEVNSCLALHNKRPVELLFASLPVSERMNLVHCTHVNSNEVTLLAKSGANVVICPTTEGNLGDGFFPFVEFLKQGGRFSIGSDSQISLCFRKELQILDYGQRLLMQKRNVSCTGPDQESGNALFWNVLASGQQAISGKRETPIALGQPLNVLLIDEEYILENGLPGKKFLSSLIFAYDHKILAATMCRGKVIVSNGRHVNESAFFPGYRATLNALLTD